MAGSTADLCFLLLVHEHPRHWTGLLRRLLEAGSRVVVHLDAKAPDSYRQTLDNGLDDLPNARTHLYWAERKAVGWGEWSMVEATLAGLARIESAGFSPGHVYLLSGSDYPIRPLGQLAGFLARHPGTDFIECADPEKTQWVQDGNQTERYRHWYFLNWKSHPRLFSALDALQRRFRVRRRLPRGLEPYIGSQWWVLTWTTCRAVLERSRDPDIRRFFRRTWIPDELFFQTLVMAVAEDGADVQSRQLTHHLFTEYGVPLVFTNGHDAYLARQPFFFARKLSPHADGLRARLDALARDGLPAPPEDDAVGRDSGAYYRYIARHRHGPEGRWSWGRPPDPVLGELGWNRRPYLVVGAASPAELAWALEVIERCPEARVHGRLFHPESIEFAGGADHWLGYGSADTRIRDQDAPAFLADLLTDADGQLLCFGWLEGVDGPAARAPLGDLRATLDRDPRCNWVELGDRPPDSHPAPIAGHGRTARRVRLEAAVNEDRDRTAQALRRIAQSAARPYTPPAFLDAISGDGLNALHRRQRLVIHIGVHRTGSTSIQQWLQANRGALRQQGILYPFATPNHNDLARLARTDRQAFDRKVHALIDAATRSKAHTLVLSAEDFSALPSTAGLARLGKVFDVRVLCYLRRQDDWLESWYNQHVKWPWNRATSALTPEAFYERRHTFDWIDYANTLERWSAVFGRQAIKVRPYDAVRSAGSVVDDFAAFCGIDLDQLSPPRPRDNASVSAPALMLLRLLRLIDKPPAERTELVRLVCATFDRRDAERTHHVLSSAQRRALVREFEASNAEVARTYLGREDGRLFASSLPPDDPTAPDIALPPVDVFREEIAVPLVRRFLGRLLAVRRGLDWNDRAQALVAGKLRLLYLSGIRQQLERLLADPRELRGRLLRFGRGAPEVRDAALATPRRDLDFLVGELGLEGLGPAQSLQLEECLAAWQGPPPATPAIDNENDATERLVETALEPLLRELGWRYQALRWIERIPPRSRPSQQVRLQQLLEATEARVMELQRELSDPLRLALRLWRARRLASLPAIF